LEIGSCPRKICITLLLFSVHTGSTGHVSKISDDGDNYDGKQSVITIGNRILIF